jgi:hypothetical protein
MRQKIVPPLYLREPEMKHEETQGEKGFINVIIDWIAG